MHQLFYRFIFTALKYRESSISPKRTAIHWVDNSMIAEYFHLFEYVFCQVTVRLVFCFMNYLISAKQPQINAFGKLILIWTQLTFESIENDKWLGWKYRCLELNFIISDMFTGSQFCRHMSIWCTPFCDWYMYQSNWVDQIWFLSNQLIHVHIALNRVNEMRCNEIDWYDTWKQFREYCSLAYFN